MSRVQEACSLPVSAVKNYRTAGFRLVKAAEPETHQKVLWYFDVHLADMSRVLSANFLSVTEIERLMTGWLGIRTGKHACCILSHCAM